MELFEAIKKYKESLIRSPEDETKCNICNLPLTTNLNMNKTCSNCGVLREENEETGKMHNVGRIRIIGSNSGDLAKDLLKHNIQPTLNNSEILNKKLFVKFNTLYHEKHNRVLVPGDIIDKTVCLYHKFTSLNKIVLRSRRKLEVLGVCLMVIYNQHDKAISVNEISEFMRLNRNSLSEGNKRIRKWALNGECMEDIKADPVVPEIITQLSKLEYKDNIRDIVSEILMRIIQVRIENRSILRTKISGIIFIILRRKKDKINIKLFCSKIGIKDNTILKFIKDVLIAYHSRFVDIYLKYGLDGDVIDEF